MQSRTEDFWAELEISDIKEHPARGFQLYEEYGKTTIAELVTTRTERFNKANADERRKLRLAVDEEVEAFKTWLEDTKGLEQDSAHYCSVSIKSLLLGLPFGVQLAQLFDVAMSRT